MTQRHQDERAKLDRLSSESIAAENRKNQYTMKAEELANQLELTNLRNANDLEIARLRADVDKYATDVADAAKSAQRELDREMQVERLNQEAELARLRRETDVQIANINAGSRVLGDTIRVTPMLIPMGKTDAGNGTKPTSTPPTQTTGAVLVEKKETAKSKADALFPDLEPTFSSKVLPSLPETTANTFKTFVKGLAAAAGAALLMGGPGRASTKEFDYFNLL